MATALDYSAIEAAVVDALDDDSWLGDTDPVNIAAWRAGLPLDVPEDRRNTLGFASFPGICVAVESVGVTTMKPGYGEIDSIVPVTVFVVAVASKFESARTTALEAREQVERVVKVQMETGADWGLNAITLTGSVECGLSLIADGNRAIAIGEVNFKLHMVS